VTARTIDTGTDQLLCELAGGVATITLNRPDKRNALSDELTPALRQTLLVVEADPEVRCVVITGAGRAFCAGGDVSGMGSGAATTPKPTLEDAVRKLQHRQETLTLRLWDLAKPTIAAGPPIALRYMKENLNRALQVDLRSALALEADRTVRCARTDDHQEAVQAFLSKRKPTFNGR
jgi:enoyl-CoA hydratase/carnithine racemase